MTLVKEEEHKSVAKVWEAFLKFPGLPMLESESVLKNAIVRGVQERGFWPLNRREDQLEDISPIDIAGDAIMVRRDIARKMKEEELGESKRSHQALKKWAHKS